MELESCLATLIIFFLLLSNGAVCEGSGQDDGDIQTSLIKRMDNIQDQLADLSYSIKSLDEEIANALRNCLGIHSELCEALEIDAGLKSQQQLGSSWGPGKRSIADDPETTRYRNLFRELRRKRAMFGHLMGVVRGADNVLKSERKRSCKLNLGFPCHTEEIHDFADMYDYLSSSKSPGKKRSVRRTP